MSVNGTCGSCAGIAGGGCGGLSSVGVFWMMSVTGPTIGSGTRLSVKSAGIVEDDGVEVRAFGAGSARGGVLPYLVVRDVHLGTSNLRTLLDRARYT